MLLLLPRMSRYSRPCSSPPPPIEPPAESRVPHRPTRLPIQTERAQRLGERFNLPISPETFTTFGSDAEPVWLERPARPRIRTTCHECDTASSAGRFCAACAHPRCPECPRRPATTSAVPSGENKENRQAGALEGDDTHGRQAARPARPAEPLLVKKKIMQRVRRTCHLCATLYAPGSRICPSCTHPRCVDCPRDP